MKPGQEALQELRHYRDLRRRRDRLIRQALREGCPRGRVALACGLSIKRIKQIERMGG